MDHKVFIHPCLGHARLLATAHSVVMNVHGQSLFEYLLPVGRCILEQDVRASVLDLRKLCANVTE